MSQNALCSAASRCACRWRLGPCIPGTCRAACAEHAMHAHGHSTQRAQVLVLRLMTVGSVEAAILDAAQQKRIMADSLITGGFFDGQTSAEAKRRCLPRRHAAPASQQQKQLVGMASMCVWTPCSWCAEAALQVAAAFRRSDAVGVVPAPSIFTPARSCSWAGWPALAKAALCGLSRSSALRMPHNVQLSGGAAAHRGPSSGQCIPGRQQPVGGHA